MSFKHLLSCLAIVLPVEVILLLIAYVQFLGQFDIWKAFGFIALLIVYMIARLSQVKALGKIAEGEK